MMELKKGELMQLQLSQQEILKRDIAIKNQIECIKLVFKKFRYIAFPLCLFLFPSLFLAPNIYLLFCWRY